MIDTHSHIYAEQFAEDLPQVLSRAAESGVQDICMPAINYDSLKEMDRLSHPNIAFHKMAGIHPTSINEGDQTTEKELLEKCRQKEIVGVGETGLDYYWSEEYQDEQKESLRIHCRVAKAVGKPIVLHNRDSTTDLLKIIAEEQNGDLKGVWHCFTGSLEEGKQALDLGLMLGIGGILTFKNAGVDDTVAQLPIEQMMLETDAPYLAPSPKRGKRNEPAFMKFIARRLGEVKQLSLEEVVSHTSENARNLFTLPVH